MPARILANRGVFTDWLLGEDGWKTGADYNWKVLSTFSGNIGIIDYKPASLPASASEGDIIIASDNTIQLYDNGAFLAFPPKLGDLAYNESTQKGYRYDGSDWVEASASSVTSSGPLTGPSTFESGTIGLDMTDPNAAVEYIVINGQWYATGRAVDTVTGAYTEDFVFQSEKGVANGVATLDGDGRLPISQLPLTAFEYKGSYNATTNTPTLVDGTGTLGDLYRVNVAGTQDYGSGPIEFFIGDKVVYNGSTWERWDDSNIDAVLGDLKDVDTSVAPVAGKQIALVFDETDSTWKKGFVKSGDGVNFITNGDAESGLDGWIEYAGGTPSNPPAVPTTTTNGDLSLTTLPAEVMDGEQSFKYVPSASSDGSYYEFSISPMYKEVKLTETFNYYVTTSGFDTQVITLAVFDVDNTAFIHVEDFTILEDATETRGQFKFSFHATDSLNYRYYIHVADAAAPTIIFDQIGIRPETYIPGVFNKAWHDVAVAQSFGGATVNYTKASIIDDTVHFKFQVVFNTTGTAGTGYTIDLPYLAKDSANLTVGSMYWNENGVETHSGLARINSTNDKLEFIYDDGASIIVHNQLSNGDVIEGTVTYEIADKKSLQIDTTENLFRNAKIIAYKSVTQAIPTGVTTPVQFNAIGAEEGGQNLNTSTGEYTLPADGWYIVMSQLFTDSYNGVSTFIGFIRQNGNDRGRSNFTVGTETDNRNQQVFALIEGKKGDLISTHVLHNSVSTRTIQAGLGVTFMSIARITDTSVFSVTGQEEELNVVTPNFPYSSTGAANNTWGNITSLDLEPGDYYLNGTLAYINSGATTLQTNYLGLSTQVGSAPTDIVASDNSSRVLNPGSASWSDTLNVVDYRITLTTATTIYLKGYCSDLTNISVTGKLQAKKIR